MLISTRLVSQKRSYTRESRIVKSLFNDCLDRRFELNGGYENLHKKLSSCMAYFVYSIQQRTVTLHAMRHMEGVNIKLNSFLTPVFHKGQWSTSQPGCFNPGKELWYQPNRRLGEPQSQAEHFGEEKNLPLEFELQIFQPIPSHYTN